MKAREDVLKVRSYPERVVVDFDVELDVDRFVVLDENGMSLHLGSERVALTWPETLQLRDIITTAEKVWVSKTRTSIHQKS